MTEDPRAGAPPYAARVAALEVQRSEALGRSTWLGRGRVATALLAFVLLVLASDAHGPQRLVLLVVGLAATAAFLVLVVRHRALRRRLAWIEVCIGLNREGLARLGRDWDALPPRADAAPRPEHPYADDLDVTGATSLERLLSTVSTAAGSGTLRRWLLHPAPTAEVLERQEAVADLSRELDFRQDLAASARLADLPSARDLEAFLDWAEADPWLPAHRWLLWTARLLPLFTLALVAAQMAGLTPDPWWLFGVAAAIGITAGTGGEVAGILEQVSTRQGAVSAYSEPLRVLAALPGDAARLRSLGTQVAGAAAAIERLDGGVRMADVRYSGMMHFPLQLLFLWDVHALARLERWRGESGHRARPWLEALGETEALAALASLAGDHPDWCFPEFDPRPELDATALGHPLIEPGTCVRNDAHLGPPGSFLLVTGSNMSGKSTLLRAVGVNAVLAQAGGPVCAQHLRMPPLDVRTSMRVADSLSEGVSYFMAELNRVAMVVRGADQAGAAGGEDRTLVLYLLDEPLQGTNEAERREALRIVLRRLIGAHAIGAVATHDLMLHRTPDLEPTARTVHLEGRVIEDDDGRERLVFDYLVRPGPATSTNALDLLRLVGLAGPHAPTPAPPAPPAPPARTSAPAARHPDAAKPDEASS